MCAPTKSFDYDSRCVMYLPLDTERDGQRYFDVPFYIPNEFIDEDWHVNPEAISAGDIRRAINKAFENTSYRWKDTPEFRRKVFALLTERLTKEEIVFDRIDRRILYGTSAGNYQCYEFDIFVEQIDNCGTLVDYVAYRSDATGMLLLETEDGDLIMPDATLLDKLDNTGSFAETGWVD